MFISRAVVCQGAPFWRWLRVHVGSFSGVVSGRWDLSVAMISSVSNPHGAVFSPERPTLQTLCCWGEP